MLVLTDYFGQIEKKKHFDYFLTNYQSYQSIWMTYILMVLLYIFYPLKVMYCEKITINITTTSELSGY